MPIPQDFQTSRVLQQLFVEIEYMPMRIAFPKDRDKTENISLETELLKPIPQGTSGLHPFKKICFPDPVALYGVILSGYIS